MTDPTRDIIEVCDSILEESLRLKKVMLFHCDSRNPELYTTGIVCVNKKDEILLQTYFADGTYDGFQVNRKVDILKIESESKYVEKLNRLFKLKKSNSVEFPQESKSVFYQLLQYAKEKCLVVTVCLNRQFINDAVGFVQFLDSKYCIIRNINSRGRSDGSTVFCISDITDITCDGREEQFFKQIAESSVLETEEVKLMSIADFLNRSIMNHEIVQVYHDSSSPNSSAVGIVEYLGDRDIILKQFLSNGKNDGFKVLRMEDIFKVERNTKYVKTVEKLMALNNTTHDSLPSCENGFQILLTYAQVKQKIVSIELNSSREYDVTGYVDSIDDSCCTIAQIDEFGEDDGTAVFDLADITCMVCDGDVEQVLTVLHELF